MKVLDVELIAINSGPVEPMIKLLDDMLDKVDSHFNFKQSVLLTDLDIKHPIHEIRKIPKLDFNLLNLFCIKDLYKHIKADHYLIVQPDGYILHPELWNDDWLNYDYIGAPWPTSILRDRFGAGAIGNGGFSLRSKFLTNHVCMKNKDALKYSYHEDGHYSNALNIEPYIKYPSINTALGFSQELIVNKNITPFGFHGKVYDPSYKYWVLNQNI